MRYNAPVEFDLEIEAGPFVWGRGTAMDVVSHGHLPIDG
jgi:hypothetical protein